MLTIGLNRAAVLISEAREKRAANTRELGGHPKDGKPVLARKGRFGLYLQWNRTLANLPRGSELDDISLDAAVELLATKGTTKGKAAKGGAAKGRAKTAKTKTAANGEAAPAKKAATKKAATKKAKPKKAAAKKAPAKKKAGESATARGKAGPA